MSVADESDPVDSDNPCAYYFVTEQGDVAYTGDNCQTVYWLFRQTTYAPAPQQPQYSQYPQPQQYPQQSQYSQQYPQQQYQQQQQYHQQQYQTQYSQENAQQQRPDPQPGVGRGRVGYSANISNPDFVRATQKTKSTQRGCAVALVIAPIIICPIWCHFSDDAFGTGLGIGLVIALVFFAFSFFFLLKGSTEKGWDGVVVNKERKRERRIIDRRDEGRRDDEYWVDYDIVTIRRDDGKTHTIKEKSIDPHSHSMHYLQVGDRVRYYARMALAYPYEKYDKSHDDTVICAFCCNRAPITGATCPRCHKPLLN